jgi:hypothetical protein
MSALILATACTLLAQMPPPKPAKGDGIQIILRFGAPRSREQAAKPDARKKEADRKWATRTAEDFLTAVINENKPSARGLLTKEAGTIALDNLRIPTPPGRAGRVYFVEQGQLRSTGSGGYDSSMPVHLLRNFKLASEEASPDGDEISFRGTFEGHLKGTFALRIVKEKESGKWRVSYFVLTSFTEPTPDKPVQPK